jgi:hypothetical protein
MDDPREGERYYPEEAEVLNVSGLDRVRDDYLE